MSVVFIDRKKKIRDFISAYLANAAYSDEDDLFKTGYVNSLFALELVTFVEKQFQIMIEDEELIIDNFRSVNAIASLVSRKVTPDHNA
jgi:acyl carrier protein